MRRDLSVGIFQANCPLQIHTLNLAKSLASAGLHVHLFLYNANEALVETDCHERLPRVTFHRIDASGFAGNPLRSIRLKRTRKQIPRPCSLAEPLHTKLLTSLLARVYVLTTHNRRAPAWNAWLKGQLVDPALTLLPGHRLDYVIGVEPYGFLWADAIGRHFCARSIYYSLEIENDRWNEVSLYLKRVFRRLRNNAIDHCDAVIIQDNDRLTTFREQTGWKGQKVFYIPVSLFGKAVNESTRFLYDELSIPEHKKVILSFGWINTERGVHQLMDAARSFDDDWVLVFHSGLPWYNEVSLIEMAKQKANGKIKFSLNRLPEHKLQSMVNSASVGLCFYSGRDENNRMTARSSEKMARYRGRGFPW